MAGDEDRIRYLTGDDTVDPIDPIDAAGLDELRALLADPKLWEEPSADLGNSIVAAIAAEAGSDTSRSSGTAPSADTVAASTPAPAPVDGDAVVTPLAPRRQRRMLSWLGPAALGAAAAGLIAFAVSRNDDEGSERAIDGTIELSGTELLPGVSGTADITEEQSGLWIQFDVPGLPRRDGDDFYQAWLRSEDGNGLVPIGSFHEGDNVSLWAGVRIDDFPILTVTRETVAGPKDPSQGTSGEVVVRGQYNE